jgi:hypothetical protein
MRWRALLWDLSLACGIGVGAYLVALFSQGPGIQFVYFAF